MRNPIARPLTPAAATETFFVGLAQPRSGVGFVGMGLWPVRRGAPGPSRKPRSGVGKPITTPSTCVPTGLTYRWCAACGRASPIPTKPALLRSYPCAPHGVSVAMRSWVAVYGGPVNTFCCMKMVYQTRGFLTQSFWSTQSRLEFLLLITLAQYCFLVGFAADYGDYGDSCSLRSRFFNTGRDTL